MERLRPQVLPALRQQRSATVNEGEQEVGAYRDIDRYVTETSQPRSDTKAQPQSDGQPLSPSRRLQALGQHKVGTSTPLLDYQNTQPVQRGATPLLPNEF
jgi:hypothetical protein